MNTNYHYLLGKHQIDLTKIAVRQPRIIDDLPNLIIQTSPSRHNALYHGYTYDSSYAGAAGLLFFSVKDIAVPIKEADQEALVVFSPNDNYQESLSELLDRAKVRLSNYPLVYIAANLRDASSILPPLTAEDKVTCYWEIRDRPTQDDVQALRDTGEHLSHSNAEFGGLKLYNRHAAGVDMTQETLDKLKQNPAFGTDGEILSLAQ